MKEKLKGKQKEKLKLKKKEVLITLAVLLFFTIYLSPLVIALSGSLRSPDNLESYLKLFSQVNLQSYRVAFEKMYYFRSFLNSVINTGVSVAVLVLFTSLAGYAIARLQNKIGAFLQIFFMAGMIVSAQMSIIPMYNIVRGFGLNEGRVAPIIMYVTSCTAFSVFLFINFVKGSVPYSLEEAATIDGAGTLYTFFVIVMPLIKPAIVSVVITQGVPIWNDFFFSMLFLSKPVMKTLPLMMMNFIGDMENTTQWNILFAACYLSAIPLLVAYGFLQRHFIGGLTVGAVKG